MDSKDITVKQQLKLSLPMGFEQLVNILMTVIDTFVVGVLGATAIAEVGAMGTILNLLFILPSTIVISNNVIIANYIGAKKGSAVKETLGNSIFLGIIFSIILCIITFLFSPLLPNMFKIPNEALIYLYIRLFGFLFLTIGTILSGYERTKGNPKFILYIKIISLFANLLLDILVIKIGYGINGVAVITVLIDLIIMLLLIVKNAKDICLKIKTKIIKKICYYIKWNTFERLITKIDFLIMNLIVANIGTLEYSVHVLLSQMVDLYRDFISGIQNGITINVGIIQGSRKYKMFKKLKKVSFKIQKFFFVFAPVLITVISFILARVYFKDNIQVRCFYEILPIILINVLLNVISIYYYAYLRGVKDFKFLANRNLISSIIKIIVAFIFSYYLGVIGVWLSYFVYSFSQYYISKKRYNKIKL